MGDNEGSDGESEVGWQLPRKSAKRKTTVAPEEQNQKRQHITNEKQNSEDNNNNKTTISQREQACSSNNNNLSRNKYALLADQEETTPAAPKPPPIYIPDVSEISGMINYIASFLSPGEFTYKSLKDGQIRLMTTTIEAYRKTVTFLDVKNVSFHTYQLKQERAYRIVLKNLHHSTPIEEIKNALEKSNHKVRNAINVRSRVSKEPLPMFFVDLEPSDNNIKIYDVKSIGNALVRIEPLRKTKDIIQCHRCQEYGHSKAYCKKPYRCVKCGLDHPTDKCSKNKTTPARCVNCLQNHTANYKGCKMYQALIQKTTNTNQSPTNRRTTTGFAVNSNVFPALPTPGFPRAMNPQQHQQQQFPYSQHNSYADAARQEDVITSNADPFFKIEHLLNKQIELMNSLLQMFMSLSANLCK